MMNIEGGLAVKLDREGIQEVAPEARIDARIEISISRPFNKRLLQNRAFMRCLLNGIARWPAQSPPTAV
jgi:hypothetical protein